MRLTPFAKAFIVVVVLGVGSFIAWHRLSRKGAEPQASAAAQEQPAKAQPKGPKRIVVGVNDFGGAYPGIVANDGALPGPSSRFTAAGLDVEVKLIRGSKERLAAFDSGEVDVMLLTLDYLANLVPVYQDKGVPLRAFLMADWSRGNLGIVSKPAIKSIEGLKTAKIATTRNTPTHYLLLSLLKKSNLTPAEIEDVKGNLVFATKTPQAGEMFKRGEVDAVAIWEPHLSQAMAEGKGRLLVSTATATNLVADVLFAREDFLKTHEAEINAFVRAWFEGVSALQRDPEAGVATIAKAFNQSADETRSVLGKIKPATFADNRAFFGLERERCSYLAQFDDAARFWLREKVITRVADAGPTRWLKALEAVQADHRAEQIVETYHFDAGPKAGVDPLLTKSVSIYFASGDATLGPNARKLVDTFADTLAEFGNAYIRVEGNTDSVGSRAANVALSKKRAGALVDYLVAQHNLDRARFRAVGNGPDKPVGDNAIETGREANRRTDFAIIPN
jgi:NitT/TauT family transport system substrate-binding protein